MKKNAKQLLDSSLSLCKEDLEQDNGLFSVLVQRKSGTLSVQIPQGDWDKMAEKMMLEFAESGHPIFVQQAHCPEVSSKAKAMENCRYTMQPNWKRLRPFFAQSAQSLRNSRRNV